MRGHGLRHDIGHEHAQDLHTPRCQHEAAGPAEAGEDRRFGEYLAHQPGAGRTKGTAQGHLLLATAGAREQEVRDVGAGDEEDECYRPEQGPQDRSPIDRKHIVQRLHPHIPLLLERGYSAASCCLTVFSSASARVAVVPPFSLP